MIVRTVPRGEERSKMLKRSFWDRYAGVYDLVTRPGSKKLAEVAAWVAGFLRPRDRPLDAACGAGTFACPLAPMVEFVLACDYSEKMLEQTRRKAARRGLRDVIFGVRDLKFLTLPRKTLNTAVCANILHLLDSPEDATAQLKMVVHPDGLIIVTNYVHETGANSIRTELINRFGFEFAQDQDAAALERFLSEQGLRIIDKRLFGARRPLEVMVCRADDDVV